MWQQFVSKVRATLDIEREAEAGDSPPRPTTPVNINVYDMYWLNEYTTPLGLGVYHTGVEIYGTEYAYGGHPFSFSGVFEIPPKDAEELGENFKFKTSIEVGFTDFTREDVALLVANLGNQFPGDQYHLLHRNCNHFAQDFVQTLCGKDLPKWVNRLATVSANIPFIEKALPKEWLTPLPPEDEEEVADAPTAPHLLHFPTHFGAAMQPSNPPSAENSEAKSNGVQR